MRLMFSSLSRSGSWQANWVLYPRVLQELARVCRPDSARAVLLTHDNKAFSKVREREGGREGGKGVRGEGGKRVRGEGGKGTRREGGGKGGGGEEKEGGRERKEKEA